MQIALPLLAKAIILAQVTTQVTLPEGMAGVPLDTSLSALLGSGWEIKGFSVDGGVEHYLLQNRTQVVRCQAKIDALSGEGGSACILITTPGQQ